MRQFITGGAYTESRLVVTNVPSQRQFDYLRMCRSAVEECARIGYNQFLAVSNFAPEIALLKTHTCGELDRKNIGERVTLAGWVDRRRDHGGLIFVDLRDRSGMVQVVFNPQVAKAAHELATELRSEFVLRITGEVAPRPKGTENTRMATGEIEVIAGEMSILNRSKTPPFYINEDVEVDENLRLKYRYLDLRRPVMQQRIILRHRIVKFIRDFLDAQGFLEIETPILIKSTPEGARDYLVPSRIYPGKFYALPQSPQQMKQLLMVAGFEKYFQIARCFRDEDSRADRQPEFTQVDIEMSFVEVEDVINLVEKLMTSLAKTVRPDMKLVEPFPRLTYAEAMERFGSDKPDFRFGLEIRDISDIVAESEFAVFRSAVSGGGKVKGICAPGCGAYTRGQLEELNELAKEHGAGGLVTIALGGTPGDLGDLQIEMVKSVAARHMTLEQVKAIGQRLNARMGDLLLVVAGKGSVVDEVLGELRLHLGRQLKLIDPSVLSFAFIQNFPLVERDKKTGGWKPVVHPFTSPREEDMALLETSPDRVRSKSYDIVCNGYEIGGGSVRIHTRELQRRVFAARGYSDEDIEDLFGHMLEAFDYGAPPHGGIALGLDRLIMLLAGAETIREVIAFPKNQNAVDLTFNAPSVVTWEQLDELHLKLHDEFHPVREDK